jgi:hypothetical protein
MHFFTRTGLPGRPDRNKDPVLSYAVVFGLETGYPFFYNDRSAGRSSNGKTGGSGPSDRGSNPCLPAIFFDAGIIGKIGARLYRDEYILRLAILYLLYLQ